MREPVPALLLAALLCAGPALGDELEEPVEVDPSPFGEEAKSGYMEVVPGNPIHLSEKGLRVSMIPGALRPPRGYTPLQVTLQNLGAEPRPVQLFFQTSGTGRLEVATRELEVGPRQHLTTFIYVPASVVSGTLRMRSPGLDSNPAPIYLADTEGAAVLVLGLEKHFAAATRLPRVEQSPLVSTCFLDMREAPRELAAYVGYATVVVAGEATALSAEAWAALEAYAATGGSLLLTRPPRDVAQHLPLLTRSEPGAYIYGFGRVRLCGGAVDCGAGLLAEAGAQAPIQPVGPAPRWERNRNLLRDGERPLLPEASAPVGRFLLLITLFALAVGPGGLMLARRKGPIALLLAVPSVAFVTCTAIIAWSVLVDGFSTHAARYSLTLLDRPRARAVILGVGGYYANLSPEGLRMPALGALLAPAGTDEQLAEVDWTNGMRVGEGFLPSRTYREWGEVAVVPTRARLSVRREGKALRVQNALGVPVAAGHVQLDGQRWVLPALAEGAEGLATQAPRDAAELTFSQFVQFSETAYRRFAGVRWGELQEALPEGAFIVRLEGVGPGPTSALPVELHEGVHFMRGQVDEP